WQKSGNTTGQRYAESGYSNGYGYQPQPRYDNYKPSYRDDRGSYQQSYDRTGSTGDDYIVVEGDTLYSIAQRFRIEPGQIAERNGITGSTIYVGQHLRLSGSPKYTGANRYPNGGSYNQGGSYGQSQGGSYNQGRTAYQGDEEDDDDRKAPPPAA